MSDKWKGRLSDGLCWAVYALLATYGLNLWIGLAVFILPMLGILIFGIVHEWVAVRRRRDSDL